tara:strand:- start:85 stop:378 length:294 start_codon:yes stop_codon:yes gene_type:complete
MSRYKNTKISRDEKDSFLKYESTIYKEVPESNNDIYVITQSGDRLDNLANQFYGDSTLWWFIGHVNNVTTMNLEPGKRLRISFDIENASGKVDKSTI